MKVTIDKQGIMVVQAENELESYALGKWGIDNTCPDNFLIQTGIEENNGEQK